MTHSTPASCAHLQDRFGRRVAARLDAAAAELPHDVAERLRAARAQALARRRVASLHPVLATAGPGAPGHDAPGRWARIGSVLPLLVLAAGLVAIHVVQNDRRARELAEIDAALLTDDLPPSAYADPGFVQFLKAGE